MFGGNGGGTGQVCKFFLDGRCRFGDSCKNEHPSNQGDSSQNRFAPLQQGGRTRANAFGNNDSDTSKDNVYNITDDGLRKDLTTGGPDGERPTWPLSAFAAGTNPPRQLIEGAVEVSPEEMRVQYYLAQAAGTPQVYVQQEQALSQQMDQQIKRILDDPAGARKYVIAGKDEHPNRYDREVHPGRDFPRSTQSGGFGQNTGFGAGGTPNAGTNLFAAKTATPTFGNSGFGAASAPPSTGGATFGSATGLGVAKPPTPSFGGPSALGAAKPPTPSFGGPSALGGGSGFGSASKLGGGSGFGTASTLGGGTPTFAAKPTLGGGAVFGSGSSLGGSGAPGGGFGGSPQQSTAGTSGFGSLQQQGPAAFSGGPKPGLFGSTPQSQSTLGQSPQPTSFASQPASGFGAATQTGGAVFGSNTTLGVNVNKPGLFGSTAANPPPTNNPFLAAAGQTGSLGGASANPTSLFGPKTSTTGQEAKPFQFVTKPDAGTSAQPQARSFGAATQPSTFGSQPQASGGFGSNFQPQSTGGFGSNSQPQAPAGFGSNPQPQPTAANFPSSSASTQQQRPKPSAQPRKLIQNIPFYSLNNRDIRIWLPDGPPAGSAPLTEAKEEMYVGELGTALEAIYRDVWATGEFRGGEVMPEVPPRRGWVDFDV